MITKSISAPTGAGVRAYVAQQATKEAPAHDILVLSYVPELLFQWNSVLTDVATMTANRWLKLPELTDHKLIIVDEMPDHVFRRLLLPMQQISTPVWLVNRDIPPVGPTIAELQAAGHLMTVETAAGLQQRPIDHVRVSATHRMVEPTLRPGEIAMHTLDGRCHVIDTGSQN